MDFLTPQTSIALIVAAALGGAVGWIVHKLGEVGRHDALVAHSKEMIRAARRARDRERVELEEVQARLDQVRDEHQECEARMRELNQEVRAARESGSGSSVKLAKMQKLREDLELRVSESESRLAEMDRALLEKRQQLSNLEHEQVGTNAERSRLRLEQEQSHATIRNLTEKLHRQSTEAKAAHERATEFELEAQELIQARAELSDFRRTHTNCDVTVRDLEQRTAETEQRLKQELSLGAPPWLVTGLRKDADDLQAIRGIGPVFEKRLNELGVYYYRQLAQLNARDTGWIAFRLNTPHERIAREGWAAQAGKLDSKQRRR